MMLPSINMMSATADSTAVKSDELQMSTTSISDTTPTDIEGTPSDTIPALSKRELRRQRVANRNLHYNILGGPSYTPDFGLLVGGSALMTFRMNPSDTTQRRSVVPMAIALMFKGGLNLMTKPQLFFKGDRFRIFGTFSYKNTIENFYGIGYSTNKDYERGEDTSEYRYSGIQVNPWFLFRLGESNFFAGPQVDLNYDKITKPAAGMVNEPSYIAAGGTEIDYRQYKTVGRRKVIAWTVQSKNAFGDVPLTKYVLSGTPFDLRGYYMGQFRDKSSHVMMAEYRQMINTDKSTWIKKMLSHIGYVAWGGCGFMGPTPGKIEGVLPNLGLGLRIEVQPRMNVRLDFGRDMVNKQNLFYFNMTEAF